MWPDTLAHQGLGLRGRMPHDGLRVLAVASHADAAMELELLWQLCASLQHQGWPVAVLDATARESANAPGLAQLLTPSPWPVEDALQASAEATQALTVLPAAHAMQRLAQDAQHDAEAALARLQPLFRSYAAVMLYAPEQWLAPLLAGSGARPLVITGPGTRGLVRSFLQIKHLALHGVRCSVAAILPPGSGPRRTQTTQALDALRQSAARLLGLDVHTTLIDAARAQEIDRLALQLLENACTIGHAAAWATIGPHHALPLSLDRSH